MDSEISMNDIYNLIQTVNSNITNRIDNVNKNVQGLTNRVDQELANIKKEVNSLKEENKNLRDRLKTTEKLLKKNNLILYGIVEEDNETNTDILREVIKVLTEKLNINITARDFSSCFRLGKKSDRSRPILFELISNFHKREILQKRSLLKSCHIYINEDLIFEERQERKVLVDALKTARSSNQEAKIKGKYLIIEGTAYTVKELQDQQNIGEQSDYHSPPPSRRASSEPSTPTVHTEDLEDIQFSQFSKEENSKPTESNPSTSTTTNRLKDQPEHTESEKKRKLKQTPSKLNPAKRIVAYGTRSTNK